MTDPAALDLSQRKLERERKARAESEAIAEGALSELYIREKEVRLLQVIAGAANESSDVDNALQIALDQVCSHTGWPVGHAYLLADDGTGELVPTVLWHLENPERFEVFRKVSESTRFKPGIGLPGRVLSNGKPLWIIDVTKDANFPRAKVADDLGVRAAFGFPVLVGTGLVGVLEFFSDVPVEPDDRLLEIMGHVGTVLGRVIERKHAEETLLEKHSRLEQALTDNLRLCDDLRIKQAQLEIASRHKSQFLANMSHELRTPLNAILGYTELILNGIYGELPEKMRQILTRVDASGRHLLTLVNDVLDLSKIEAGQLKLRLQDYSMHELVHSVVTVLEPLAAGKQIALKAIVPSDLPQGRGDEARLHQVLMNLVGNAIKFTDSGDVKIQVINKDGQFRVSVTDTGPGIEYRNQERIFEEFQQADSSSTREKGGTGLGLAIVKRIVHLHGGHLGVESEPAHGATFWFKVPTRVERQAEAT